MDISCVTLQTKENRRNFNKPATVELKCDCLEKKNRHYHWTVNITYTFIRQDFYHRSKLIRLL
jgi:hypothetical protein